MTQIDTLNAILDARYSCRAFRPDPVPDTDIARIIDKIRRHLRRPPPHLRLPAL